jgi:hypothetical protein
MMDVPMSFRVAPARLLLLLLVCVSPSLAQKASGHGEPLLHVAESTVDMAASPLWTTGGCIVVDSGGQTYIEKRSQLAFSRRVDLTIYGGMLAADELARLKVLLADDALVNLGQLPKGSEMGDKVAPKAGSTFGWISVQVHRSNAVQQIDYRHWANSEQAYSGADSSFVARQKQVLKALLPLMSWIHSLDLSQFKRVPFDESKCASTSENSTR